MLKKLLLPLFFLCSVCQGLQAQALEIIELRNRPAEELLPLLQPLVAGKGALSGQGFNLLVRTDAATLAEIKALVARLDSAPRNLLISVRQVDRANRMRAQDRVSGQAQVGDAEVRLGDPPRHASGASIELSRHTRTDRDDGSYQVRTLEGRPAWIETGSDRPVIQQRTIVSGQAIITEQTTSNQQIRSGFLVTPHIRGQQVLLEIAPQRQTPAGGGAIATQGLQTSVLAPFGEWVELGGIDLESHSNSHDLTGRQSSSANRAQTTEVKVELLP